MFTFKSVGKNEESAVELKKKEVTRPYGSSTVFNSQDDLRALPSSVKRFRDELVGDKFAMKVCPAELESGQWILFVTPDYVKSDMLKLAYDKTKNHSGGKVDPIVQTVTPMLLLSMREETGNKSSAIKDKEQTTAYLAAFQEIISWALRQNAADVHMNVNKRDSFSQIHFSIEGKYVAPLRWRIKTDRMIEILNVAWMESQGGSSPTFNGDSEQQCRIEMRVDNQPIMLRWASLATDRGPSVTLRLLKVDQKSVNKDLYAQGYLPSQVSTLMRAQSSEGGAIIIAGVVGSGKSTTLASMLSSLPHTRKLITLEDPVEYLIPNALQNTISRSLKGDDADAFKSKLRTIKRSAPQDLMISEIRDRETGEAFVDIVGSGTNVYATVHAKSALHIPERLASSSIAIPKDILASPGILNLLMFQALIPTLCKHCSHTLASLCEAGEGVSEEEAKLWTRYKVLLTDLYKVNIDGVRVRNAQGCNHCIREDIPDLNGYAGRTVVAELVEPGIDSKVLRLIREGDTIGLREYFDNFPKAPIDDQDMTGKSMMECAVYKMLGGLFDPRDVEARTESFETTLLRKEGKK